MHLVKSYLIPMERIMVRFFLSSRREIEIILLVVPDAGSEGRYVTSSPNAIANY